MPAAIPAAIGAVASVGGALISSKSASKAANAQVQSADKAIEEQRRQFDTTREDLAPWRDAGASSLSSLMGRLPELTSAPDGSKFHEDPGYKFAFSEGQRAVESGGAARGMLMSGGTLKDLTRFGTGIADQQYGNWYNREQQAKDSAYNKLSGVAGMGQASAAQVANLGRDSANSISGLLTDQGNARASGYAGQSAAWQNGLGNLATLATRYGGGSGFMGSATTWPQGIY